MKREMSVACSVVIKRNRNKNCGKHESKKAVKKATEQSDRRRCVNIVNMANFGATLQINDISRLLDGRCLAK